MPVEIGEVDVLAADEPREPRGAGGEAPASHARGDDPMLAIAMGRAIALRCSRDLRLRAD